MFKPRKASHRSSKSKSDQFRAFRGWLNATTGNAHPFQRTARCQDLEPRLMLFGNPVANADSYVIPYYAGSFISAPGVLGNDTDPNQGAQLFAHLVSGPSHANTFQLNQDGSFHYATNNTYLGTDSFSYYDTDTYGMRSNTVTVTLNVEYSVQSTTDLTKQVAINPLDTGLQILGTASGAPATAQNLSLAYDSVAAQPDAVIEGLFQFNTIAPINDTATGTLTFNGVAQSATYVNLNGMNGSSANVDLSYQVDTSALPTGRYPYTFTLNGNYMSAPATISGAMDVVNDSSGPMGNGWDIPGLYRLYQNNVSGVPAGALLTTGDGHSWYFQGSGNSYTSPHGPFAFDTLTSITGGGWKLVDKHGTTFNFGSTGNLLTRVARTGETTTYGWTNGLLTSITDQFSRSVSLGYTSGQLSSVTDDASHVWSIAHTGANLTSVTAPDPGGGAPVWQYGYTGNYLTTVTDPNNNQVGYVLDSHHRVSQVNLPGGASASDTSEQSMAYGGPTYAGAPNVTPSANVQTTSTDANNNTTSMQTDVFGNPLSSTDANGHTTTWQRDANGLVTSLTEPSPDGIAPAPVTNYTYDSLGNQTSASGAHPSYGTFVYNTVSEPTSFTDSQNHVRTWSYDTNGNLLSETDPLNNTVNYTVDSLGYPLTMVQPAPNNGTGTVTTTYTRDQYERLTKITWPDNTFRTFTYDTLDRPTSVTDENSHALTTNYDALGRVTSLVNALNGTVSTTYDKDGNVLTTTDEMGNVTTNQWNARNELTQQTLPIPATGQSAPVLSFTYDANGNKLTSTDPLGRVTSFSWDKMDRMTQETLPVQVSGGQHPTILYAYDNLSRKTSETNALNQTTTWTYGNTDVGQVTKMTLPVPAQGQSSPVWTYAYDSLGRQYQTTDPMNHVQTTSFDADGNVTSVLDNLNHGPTYTYGRGGELLTTVDSLSHTTTNQYDSRYRQIQTTDANGGVTQITLDAVGDRTKLVDPANNTTTWVFDALNRPISETNALGTTTTSYDASSDVTSIIDADGRVRDFTFDNLHRQTMEQWMNGNSVVRTITTTYDADNEVTSMSDPDSAFAFTFNGDGQRLTLDNSGTPNIPHVVLTSGYDLAGDHTSLSATVNGTADFINTYEFDSDQRLTTVQQQQRTGGNGVAQKEIDLSYDALGQFSALADYNLLSGPRTDVATGAYSYDGGNRLTGLGYTANGGATHIDAYTLGFDNANHVTSMTSSADGSATYTYDGVSEITSATYTGNNQPANESYSYDKNGNRTMTGYTTGADNIVASDGTFNYQYDADGNRAVRTRIATTYAVDHQTRLTYDYRNRLTDEHYYDNNGVLTKHVHYVYDVFDREIGKQVDDTGNGTYDRSEWYTFDGAQPVLHFGMTGNMTERDLLAPSPSGVDAVMAAEAITTQGQAGTLTWNLPDNLGTPRDSVNNNSAVVDHIITNSYGQIASQSNSSAQPWNGFAGGHIDADTGDVTNLLRRYDPTTGGWTTKDPLDFAARDPNTGRYVDNSPTNAADPTGLLMWPPPPYVGNPNGSYPVSTYGAGVGWTPTTTNYVNSSGCFALCNVNTGIYYTGYTGPLQYAPGVAMFPNYNQAQQYAAANPGSVFFAYQNTMTQPLTPDLSTSTPGFVPVAPGQLDPASIPNPQCGEQNWATLMQNAAGELFWQTMANAQGNVENMPFVNAGPNYGLPATGHNTTANVPNPYTTFYGVYVPPPPPPPSPSSSFTTATYLLWWWANATMAGM